MQAKHLFPVDVITDNQLKQLGIKPLDGVKHYEVRVLDSENPILDESGAPTGKTLADLR